MKTTFFRSLIFLLFFVAGYSVIQRSAPQFQINRDPAAIRQTYDFSYLTGNALEGAVKERLISGIEIFKEEGAYGVGLGHFVMMSEGGEKTLGCREYNKIILSFEAEGQAVSGVKPQMEVEGSCEYSTDLAKINPLWIPVAKVLGERPADGEFQFHEGRAVTLRFNNVSDEWPRKWVLIGMKILGGKKEVSVDKADVAKVLGHPFMINLQ